MTSGWTILCSISSYLNQIAWWPSAQQPLFRLNVKNYNWSLRRHPCLLPATKRCSPSSQLRWSVGRKRLTLLTVPTSTAWPLPCVPWLDCIVRLVRSWRFIAIFHNDGWVHIYKHYPEIDGDTTTYHCTAIWAFSYADNNAQERETAYRFVWNMFTIFAPAHLKRLKEAISCLRDPLYPAANAWTPFQTPTMSGDNAVPLTPVTSNPGPMFVKPGPPQRHNSATVSQQVEQQRREIMAQFEQLKMSRQEVEEREDKLMN